MVCFATDLRSVPDAAWAHYSEGDIKALRRRSCGMVQEVDNMRNETRHQIDALVETVNIAWTNLPMVKVLRAFEMRRDVADEMLREHGACPTEGKGGRGAHRVHTHPAYAPLRARLGIETDAW